MSWRDKENNFINVLEKTGLNHNEARIYFELLKHGIRGTTAYDLDHHFEEIKRTTIYSILKKLIALGCIREKTSSKAPKKATVFVGVEPETYFDFLISSKKEELRFLEELKEKNIEYFEMIYSSGLEYDIKDVDSVMLPYLEPLMETGWNISSYYLKEDVPVFGYSIFDTMLNPPKYSVYDIMLTPPKFKLLKDSSFHLFIFNFEIENDENALKFFIDSLKKQTLEIISFFSDIKEYVYEEVPLDLFNTQFTGLSLKIKKRDLGKIFKDIKSKIRVYWDEDDERRHFDTDSNIIDEQSISDPNEQIDVWKAVIIPIKNKIFFLWSESLDLLKKMAKPIFLVENLTRFSK